MFRNIDQLDQIQLLKIQYHPKIKPQNLNILYSYRNYTHFRQQIFASIFAFWHQKKKESKIKQLVVTSQLPIISLQSFKQIINETLPQKQFTLLISKIQQFKFNLMKFLQFDSSQFAQVPISGKNIDYAIFMNKKFQFYIKAYFKDFGFFVHFKKNIQQWEKPNSFIIQNQLLTKKLEYKYLQKFKLPLVLNENEIYQKSRQFYEQNFFHNDQQVLNLQITYNFPSMRSKYFVPIKFQDSLTGKELKGTIYSNSDIQCMYGHFSGFYDHSSQKMIKGQACHEFSCGIIVQQLKQNQLIMFLRDNVLNPQKRSVMYCPEYNRFKIIKNGRLVYSNYRHFVLNLKKMTTKNRKSPQTQNKIQRQIMTFQLFKNSKKLLIQDPGRGKHCNHMSFCDLRQIYLTKDQEDEYECPICHIKMKDNDILYLRQALVIIKYLEWKFGENGYDGSQCICQINNETRKVVLQYEIKSKKNTVVLDELYKSLADPYVRFNEHELGIPNKKQQKAKRRYLLSGLQNEIGSESDMSDDQIRQIDEQQDNDIE